MRLASALVVVLVLVPLNLMMQQQQALVVMQASQQVCHPFHREAEPLTMSSSKGQARRGNGRSIIIHILYLKMSDLQHLGFGHKSRAIS